MATDPNPTLFAPEDLRLQPVAVVAEVPRPRPYWLHALLFLVTIFTTLIVGARLEFNFLHNLPAFSTNADFFPVLWVLEQPSRLLLGIPFSATLLGILLMHEMGHVIYCARHRVYATLPFFIPAPTLTGTLGAFIRIKAPIPHRDALFDIGISGPLAGFLVAVPMVFVSLLLSKPASPGAVDAGLQFGYPLIFDVVHALLRAAGFPIGWLPWELISLHPIGLAAFVGMFATALNLLPAGQLDGGHIVYALWPRAHRMVSRLLIVILLPLGWMFWPGWLIWGLLVAITGTRHPQVPSWPPLHPRRRALALLALVMLALTFMHDPFPVGSIHDMVRQRFFHP